MKKFVPLFLILALVLLIVGATMLYDELSAGMAPPQLATQPSPSTEPSADPSVEPSQDTAPTETQPQVPDFTVYDREGNAVKLSDYFGKPMVLNFWASWCGPCKMEMPDFDAAHRELGEEVQFLMVNMTGGRETLDTATAFLDGVGYTFPVVFDLDGDAAATYGVYSLPTTYFIDADGHGVAYAQGAIDADTLQRGIDMIYTAD